MSFGNQTLFFDNLPTEMILHIGSFLFQIERQTLAQTSKRYYAIFSPQESSLVVDATSIQNISEDFSAKIKDL